MTKIIKYACMVFVAGCLISLVVDYIEDQKREKARAEQYANYDPSKTIGGQMVRNVIDSATDVIEAGDDAEPILGEAYTDADGEEWIFSKNPRGGIRVSFNKKGISIYNLEKIGTGVYNTFYPNKEVDAGYIIRMIDEGRAIEVQQGKGERKVKAIFKTSSSTLGD